MGQRSIRFPDGLEQQLLAVAEAEGRSFSNVVVWTLERALHASGDVPEPSPGAAPARTPEPRGDDVRIATLHPEDFIEGPGTTAPVKWKPAPPSVPAPQTSVRRVDPNVVARMQRLNKPKGL
jgi:hypothetical protein